MQNGTKAPEILCKSSHAQGETLHNTPESQDDDLRAEQLGDIVKACFPREHITSPVHTFAELAHQIITVNGRLLFNVHMGCTASA